MSITVGTDSYIAVATADAYFGSRLYADPWTAADATTKEAALKMATKAIDRLRLRGRTKTDNQTLAFPRCYPTLDRSVTMLANGAQLYMDGNFACEASTPQRVLDAACEEALALLREGAENNRRRLQAQGVSSFKLGDLSETFRSGGASAIRSPEALSLLAPFTAVSVGTT